MFKYYQQVSDNDDQSMLNIDEKRKNINSLYLKQLLEILRNSALDDEFYESVVVKVETESGMNTYAAAIQTLLISHTLGVESNVEDDNIAFQELISEAKGYIQVMSVKRQRRLLEGVREVRNMHEFIDLT